MLQRRLLAPDVIKDFIKKICAEVRKSQRPDNVDEAARQREIDRQIDHLANTICNVGRSDILTAKLQSLEEEHKQILKRPDKSRIADIVTGAADQWRATV